MTATDVETAPDFYVQDGEDIAISDKWTTAVPEESAVGEYKVWYYVYFSETAAADEPVDAETVVLDPTAGMQQLPNMKRLPDSEPFLIGTLELHGESEESDQEEVAAKSFIELIRENYTNTEGFVTSKIAEGQAELTKAPAAAENLTYNGKAQALVTAGEAANGTVVYSLTADGEFTAEVPTASDAGKYTVYYKVSGNANYVGTEAESIEVTIAAKAITATAKADDKDYDGTTDANVTVTADTGIEGETITISGVTGAFADANAGADKAVKLDTAKAEITVTGKASNYEITLPTETKATITKAEAKITVALDGWTYDDKANTPAVSGDNTLFNAELGTKENAVTYTYFKGEEQLKDVPTDAGTYTVKATVTGMDNFTDASAEAAFTIAKAPITLALTMTGWTESDKASEPNLTGAPDGASVTYTYYAKGSDKALESAPTTAGDYTVKAVVGETANYLGGTASADFDVLY